MIQKIILLMGPTAAGKTAAVMRLAQDLPCHIISVDSAQVYRKMDIGTAKPTPAILEKFPHTLINIRDVTTPYSAADFRNDALIEIEFSFKNGKIPILVGGTMLYYHVLLQGLATLPRAASAVRTELTLLAQQIGWPKMHAQLLIHDPESAQHIHPNDPQRIQRALEVFYTTGVPFSVLIRQQARQKLPYLVLAISLAPLNRGLLHKRIETRFITMLNNGFLEEVHQFFSDPNISRDLPAMRSVGYRQAWDYFAGDYSKQAMIEKCIAATRQLAKRQLTWLRHWPEINWFDSSDNYYDTLLAKIQDS